MRSYFAAASATLLLVPGAAAAQEAEKSPLGVTGAETQAPQDTVQSKSQSDEGAVEPVTASPVAMSTPGMTGMRAGYLYVRRFDLK